MPKHYPVNKSLTSHESAEPGDVLPSANLDLATVPSFWILKDATARKIGKRSEGVISYQILADADRKQLFVGITANSSSGYFSREKVPFQQIRACLSSFPDKAFPSKALRDAFVGCSSNNPPFMAGILADLGLIAADTTIESRHKAIGDWTAWEQTMLALPGTLLQADAAQALPDADDAIPDHTPTAPAEESPPAKARKGGKPSKEASYAGDTPSE